MATAVELLTKAAEGRRYRNVQLEDVEEILANEAFTSDMLVTTEDGKNTLLHLAAPGRVDSVFPLVVQAYKRAKLFSAAMGTLNTSNCSPLDEAIYAANFENSVMLFRECLASCPEVLSETRNEGSTLLHKAASCTDNVNLVKYLLAQGVCQPMLLALWTNSRGRSLLPLDVARDLKFSADQQLKFAKSSLDFHSRKTGNAFQDKIHNESMYRARVTPAQEKLDKANELYSILETPTVEAKAMQAEKLSKELEKKKFMEREEKIFAELTQLLQDTKWDSVVEGYWLSEDEEVQKITMKFLASEEHMTQSMELPALTQPLVSVLMCFLQQLSEEDSVVLSTLALLSKFTERQESNQLLCECKEGLDTLSHVVSLMRSLTGRIQCVCTTVLLNITTHKPEGFSPPDDWVQPLLLLKHFSLDSTAKELALQALSGLGGKPQQPDPGSWTVTDVSLWMESNTTVEKRTEYRKSFAEAEIDGLHLLELSSSEMAGLGIKYVSDQRKLSNAIDELRRMNMRSMVGKKDIFLSYAHINIGFARKLKTALNNANYTVWIDEAGIRAGHKWRNEIADGIESSKVLLFVMSARSSNSEYCQDELALAEEYKKPIMTARYQNETEMDPGMKLIVQRRQWIDFREESEFDTKCEELVGAIFSAMGAGSGPERVEEEETGDSIEHPKPSLQHTSNDESTAETSVVQELVREIEQLKRSVEVLTERVNTLEKLHAEC